jgi:hypothetical protein
MANQLVSEETRAVRRAIVTRLRHVSIELFSERRSSRMAEVMGLSLRTYQGILSEGRAVPGTAILRLITEFRVSHSWLLYGTGSMFEGGRNGCTKAAG